MEAIRDFKQQFQTIKEKLFMCYALNWESQYLEYLDKYNNLVDEYNLISEEKMDRKINEFEQERQRIANMTKEELEEENRQKMLKDMERTLNKYHMQHVCTYIEKYADLHQYYVMKYNELADEYNELSGEKKYKHIYNMFEYNKNQEEIQKSDEEDTIA